MIIKRQLVGHWWCDVALVLTLVALFCNNVSFAKNDFLPEVTMLSPAKKRVMLPASAS